MHSADLMVSSLYDWQGRGAGLGALGTIDARGLRAMDAQRTEQGSKAEQRSVGTQMAAPEVLHQNRRHYQDAEHDDGGLTQMAKEVQHAGVRDCAVGTVHELRNRFRRHVRNGPDKKSQQQILHTSQGQIKPARQRKVTMEDLPPRAPQIFGKCSYGAEPTAKCLAQQECDCQKTDEEKQGCWMAGRKVSGGQPIP